MGQLSPCSETIQHEPSRACMPQQRETYMPQLRPDAVK